MEWPESATLKQLCFFLGLAGYYRRFIQGYGVLAKAFDKLIKEGLVQMDLRSCYHISETKGDP